MTGLVPVIHVVVERRQASEVYRLRPSRALLTASRWLYFV